MIGRALVVCFFVTSLSITTVDCGVSEFPGIPSRGCEGGAENARVDNAGVDNVARSSKGGQHGSGQRGIVI